MRYTTGLLLLALFATGCSGGGGTTGGTVPQATSGSIAVRIESTPLARGDAISIADVNFEVDVESAATGQLLVPAVTASRQQNGTTIVVAGVPLGPTTVVVKGFDSTGLKRQQGQSTITVQPGANSATVTELDSGALTAIATVPTGQFPEVILFHGQFVYVTNFNSANISAFSFNQGTLTPIPGSPFQAGTQANTTFGEALTPDGQFLYACNFQDGTLAGFSVNPQSGALTMLQGFPLEVAGDPELVSIDPSGQFLYETNKFTNNIAGFQIGSGGSLQNLTGSPYSTGANPFIISIGNTSQFLYVPNIDSASLFTYQMANGVLSQIQTTTLAKGSKPSGPALDATNHFLYLAEEGADVISPFSVASNGQLTSLGSPVPAGSASVTLSFDPTNHFLYCANEGDDTISAFLFDSRNGSLIPINGSPFSTGATVTPAPAFVAVDPSGRFLLASNSQANNLTVFTINP